MNDQDNQNNTAQTPVNTQPTTNGWPPASGQPLTNPTPNDQPQPTWPAAQPTAQTSTDFNSMTNGQTPAFNATPTLTETPMGFPSTPSTTPVSNPTLEHPTAQANTPPAWPSEQPNMNPTFQQTTPAFPTDNTQATPQTTTMDTSAFGQPSFANPNTPATSGGTTNTTAPAPSNQNLLEALYATSPNNPVEQPNVPTNPFGAVPESAPNPIPTFQNPSPTPMPSPEMPVGGTDFNSMPQNPVPESNAAVQNPTAAPMDSAPTDLSHLIGNTEAPPPPDIYTPPVATDSLAVPTAAPTAVPESIDTSHSGSKNKLLLIIVGVMLLLAVAAACAYFILGIGRTSETTSVPAVQEQTPLTNPPVINTPTPTTEATPSGGFGLINPSATPSASKAPTAAELLRQRSQTNATPSSGVFGPNSQ